MNGDHRCDLAFSGILVSTANRPATQSSKDILVVADRSIRPAVELTQGVVDLLQFGFQHLDILAFLTSLDQLSLKIELPDAQLQRFLGRAGPSASSVRGTSTSAVSTIMVT